MLTRQPQKLVSDPGCAIEQTGIKLPASHLIVELVTAQGGCVLVQNTNLLARKLQQAWTIKAQTCGIKQLNLAQAATAKVIWE